MKIKILILLVVTITLGINGYTQTYDKPNEPTFNYLTIDPATGLPTLHWTAPSVNPQYPNPIGYIIYKRIFDNLGNDPYTEIDTVDQNTFSYTDINSNGNQARVFYGSHR